MAFFLLSLQALVSILLIFGILLQHRAAGLSATFGGVNTSYVQRRGAEKLLYQVTIILTVLFFVLTVVQWYI